MSKVLSWASQSRRSPCTSIYTINSIMHYMYNSFIHSFLACTTMSAYSAKRRHHSPEWTILSNVNCFIQGEVQWFQVLLGSLHPCSMGASRWSPPVLQGEAVKICSAWHYNTKQRKHGSLWEDFVTVYVFPQQNSQTTERQIIAHTAANPGFTKREGSWQTRSMSLITWVWGRSTQRIQGQSPRQGAGGQMQKIFPSSHIFVDLFYFLADCTTRSMWSGIGMIMSSGCLSEICCALRLNNTPPSSGAEVTPKLKAFCPFSHKKEPKRFRGWDEVISEVARCLSVQTPVHHHTQLVFNPLGNDPYRNLRLLLRLLTCTSLISAH